jgi:capsid protein
MDFKNGLKTMFGYNAIQNKGRRKAPKTRVRSENRVLRRPNREKLIATIKELSRNNAVFSWALRKHLDYISNFTFQAKTGDIELNKEIERRWAEWSKKKNCDIAQRHSLQEMIRLFETGKIFDGDSGLLKVDGMKLQGVESDRIGFPKSNVPEGFDIKSVNEEGLVLNDWGAVEQYIVNSRTETDGLKFQTAATPDQIIFDGYFQRFDQTRGISPLATAVNTFLDIDECNEALLLKCKKHGMFGLAIMSDSSDSSGFNEYDGETGDEPDADTDKYDFNMDMGLKIELDEGDKIDMFESKTPSNEYQDYVNLMLRIALLSFDIPYTFFDSRQSSYSAQKQDRAEYEIAAKNKRAKNQEVLNEIAEWVLPSITKGLGVDSLEWEFIPQATPWIDELKEVQAAAMRISSGLSTRQLECKKKGLEFTEINEQLGKEEEQIKESGATIVIGQSGQMTIGEIENGITE